MKLELLKKYRNFELRVHRDRTGRPMTRWVLDGTDEGEWQRTAKNALAEFYHLIGISVMYHDNRGQTNDSLTTA